MRRFSKRVLASVVVVCVLAAIVWFGYRWAVTPSGCLRLYAACVDYIKADAAVNPREGRDRYFRFWEALDTAQSRLSECERKFVQATQEPDCQGADATKRLEPSLHERELLELEAAIEELLPKLSPDTNGHIDVHRRSYELLGTAKKIENLWRTLQEPPAPASAPASVPAAPG